EKGRQAAKERQKIILRLMLEQGRIDQKEYEQALKEEITFYDKGETEKSASTQSYFVDQVINDVREDLMKEKGLSKTMASALIYGGGLKIYTTMDPDVQKVLDEVFMDEKYYIGVEEKTKNLLEHPEAGMVVIDPETGQVKGMRGGFGEKKASMTLNRATQIERQPGSSFKPIAVYAPAIDIRLITPATVIDDKPIYLGTGKNADKPFPRNFDRKYSGLVTIRDAIKRSINVVAASVWMQIPDESLAYLKKVGINRDNERYVSIALGAPSKGVSPLQMAAAYVPFVHKGMYFEPTTYTKVYDSKGNLLLEKKPQYYPVYNETTAFLMVDMMKNVINSPGGTAYPRGIIKNGNGEVIPTAGKTGTTSDNKDKWFVGYSPYYVAATWYGYDHPRELIGNERNQALIIWHDVMEKLHQNKEVKDFEQPPGLVKKRICIYSGKIATELCAKDPRGSAVREEYFIKGTEPRDNDRCEVHVTAVVCTESKDAWGKNLLAGPYCPPESVVEKVFIQRTEPYVPQMIGETPPTDWTLYELPAGEYCTIHGEPAEPITDDVESPFGTDDGMDTGTTNTGDNLLDEINGFIDSLLNGNSN
ncbi:MAG TPA: penicillin-binding protein, partial [Clostridiaceae bacterium]|nr:penicillin-binding protein [Clostridiaceae bacterium]